ncbi:hypothetical protein HYFRA_00006618 [Hymenoscyphus fraxineus]|uniref:Uncharacterized protein n=1 Tax=Hymenoscyphus fraxineus TaxID=746836 RepID=A0A9N9KTQ2_9HELO|nr:hypothetical protein HYFRA_00006618 [Hymenoscyphus fraxineus]
MEKTTTRLRKAFRYHSSDEDSDPEAMDEEEQDRLIRTLHLQNETLNKTYTRILLTLPLVATSPYLLSFSHLTTFSTSTSTPPFLSLLCLTSLLSTAYLVLTLPPEKTGFPYLDTPSSSAQVQSPKSRAEKLKSRDVDGEGPIRQWLPVLNVLLCGVLLLLGRLAGGRSERRGGEEAAWELIFCGLPAGIYGIVLCGKWVMASVDPERELGELRYGYKGA